MDSLLPDAGTVPEPSTVTAQRNRMPAWAGALLALGVILVLVVAFVTLGAMSAEPEQQPSAVPPTAAPKASEPSVTPQPEAAHTVLPECDTANLFAMTLVEGQGNTEEVDSHKQRGAFGPAANHALSNSVQSRGCGYPGPLIQVTAELSPEVLAELLKAVRSQGDTVESTHGIATAYTWSDRPFEEPEYDQSWAYVFIENVWIALYLPASDIESIVIDSAVDGVLRSNPQFDQ